MVRSAPKGRSERIQACPQGSNRSHLLSRAVGSHRPSDAAITADTAVRSIRGQHLCAPQRSHGRATPSTFSVCRATSAPGWQKGVKLQLPRLGISAIPKSNFRIQDRTSSLVKILKRIQIAELSMGSQIEVQLWRPFSRAVGVPPVANHSFAGSNATLRTHPRCPETTLASFHGGCHAGTGTLAGTRRTGTARPPPHLIPVATSEISAPPDATSAPLRAS